jgi:hypothetical protein
MEQSADRIPPDEIIKMMQITVESVKEMFVTSQHTIQVTVAMYSRSCHLSARSMRLGMERGVSKQK